MIISDHYFFSLQNAIVRYEMHRVGLLANRLAKIIAPFVKIINETRKERCWKPDVTESDACFVAYTFHFDFAPVSIDQFAGKFMAQ